MQLDIVTPDRRVVIGDTTDVIIPAIEGELEVLPGHAPFISVLGTGVLTFTQGGKPVRLMVSGGFVEVADDRVTLMADKAALTEEVEHELERKQLTSAEEQLQKLGAVATHDETYLRLQAEVDRAVAKISLIR